MDIFSQVSVHPLCTSLCNVQQFCNFADNNVCANLSLYGYLSVFWYFILEDKNDALYITCGPCFGSIVIWLPPVAIRWYCWFCVQSHHFVPFAVCWLHPFSPELHLFNYWVNSPKVLYKETKNGQSLWWKRNLQHNRVFRLWFLNQVTQFKLMN